MEHISTNRSAVSNAGHTGKANEASTHAQQANSYVYQGNKEQIIEDQSEKHCPFRAVWRAVITQAIIDITSGSRKTADIVERNLTESWFSKQCPDFMTVCTLADLDPSYVLERVKIARQYPKKWKKIPKNKLPQSQHSNNSSIAVL